MPGPIRTDIAYGQDPALEELKRETRELRRDLHDLAKTIAKQNPAPAQNGMSENVLLQLLMSEREKAERQSDRLAELQNPLAQIEQLQALASLMPSQPEESGNKMLEEVISTVGGLVAAKMVKSEAQEGDGAAHHHDEETYDPGEP
jgi:arginine/lysine/ornithine decarboxylase|tara:strand:+ start:1194 stop:1631 length:438 start_codon:yes stop_codon:yes gene_type:complete